MDENQSSYESLELNELTTVLLAKITALEGRVAALESQKAAGLHPGRAVIAGTTPFVRKYIGNMRKRAETERGTY